MGMSASQARLIQLEARQSNLEYQGQQINQERTILSQQCTDLYNSLLTMSVPTPPSTQDYTTIQYSGVDGATTFKLGNIKPDGNKYSLELQWTKNGDGIDKNYTKSKVSTPEHDIKVNKFNGKDMGKTTAKDAGAINSSTPNGTDFMRQVTDRTELKEGDEVWTLSNGTFTKTKYSSSLTGDIYVKDTVQQEVKDEAGNVTTAANYGANDHLFTGVNETSSKRDNTKTYYVKDGDSWRLAGTKDFAEDGSFLDKEYAVADKEGEASIVNPEYASGAKTVAGNRCYTLQEAVEKDLLTTADKDRYESAIKNSGYDPDKMYIYFDGNKPQFVLKTVVENALLANSETNYAETYSFTNTTFTQTEPKNGCELEFDVSGRIVKISIPTEDGQSMRQIPIEATKVTDEVAYQDAYNDYEYAMYEYDKKQQEINAKTEVIQQEDRNLELKLQRLDNERQQITTEIEAVQKVIDDNIEASYKTFSG